MENNYNKQLEYSMAEFLKWDQEAIIKKLGLAHDNNYIYISYIGRQYQVNRFSGEVTNMGIGHGISERAEYNAAMPIYDIFCYSKENAHLSHVWRPFQGLSPSPTASFDPSDNSMFKQYAEHFSGRLPELNKACIKLGGNEIHFKGDVNYVFDIFPFFPAQLQFWDSDDEFPGKIVILMDLNLLDFIHFETAWFIAFHLLQRISEAL